MSSEEQQTKFSPQVTFEGIREIQSAFCKERDWDQFHSPRNLLLALVGEVGELSELFQWKGDEGCKVGLPDWNEESKKNLEEELSDIRLSEKCGVDLPAAALRKIEKNAKKYPAELVRGSNKKYTEYKNT